MRNTIKRCSQNSLSFQKYLNNQMFKQSASVQLSSSNEKVHHYPLQIENEKLQKQLQIFEEEIFDLKNQLEKQKKFNSIQSRSLFINNSSELLEMQIQSLEQKLQQTTQNLQNTQQALNKKEQLISQLQKKKQELEKAIQFYKLNNNIDYNRKLREQADNVMIQLDTLKQQLQTTKQQLKTTQGELENEKMMNYQHNLEIQVKQLKKIDFSSQISNFDDIAEKKIQYLTSQVSKQDKLIDQLNDKYQKTLQLNQELEQQQLKSKSESSIEETQMKQKMHEINQNDRLIENEKLNNDLRKLSEELEQEKLKYENLQKELVQLKVQNDQKLIEIQNLETKKVELVQLIENQQAIFEQQQNKQNQLVDNLANLQEIYEAKEKEHNQLNSEMKRQLDENNSKQLVLMEQLQKCQQDFQDQEQQIYILQEQKKELGKLIKENIKFQIEQRDLYNETWIQDLQKINQSQLHKVEEKQKKIQILTEKLDELSKRVQIECDKFNEQKEAFFVEYQEKLKQITSEKNIEIEMITSKFQKENETLKQRLEKQQEIQGLNEENENLRKKYEQQIKKLTEEHLQSEKLLTKQNEILNKKVSDLQNLISSKTLELQKSKGNRRTSKIQADSLQIQLAQKDAQIQELESNLIETKQSFEILMEKAKQMEERNRQLKEKVITAQKQIKQEEELSSNLTNSVIFDLIITNELETLQTLVGKGWLFVKSNASPMKPFKRFICFFSYDSELLEKFLMNYFSKEAIQHLVAHRVFVLIENEICYLVKLLNHCPQEMITNFNDIFDHWDEMFLELSIKNCNTLVLLASSSIEDEEIITSLVRLNPPNLIIITQDENSSKILASMFNLPIQENEYYSNNRIKVITKENKQLGNLLLRSHQETDSLFLDIFKNFFTKNYNLFFEQNSEKPSIKITKLPAANAFNYQLVLNKTKLNYQRNPILLNNNTPIFSIESKNNVLSIKFDLKNKIVSEINAQILTSFQNSFYAVSLIQIQLTLDERLQKKSYLLQLPYSVTVIKEINKQNILCQ